MNTESQFLFGFFLPNAGIMPKNIDKRIDFVELLKDFSTAYLLSNRIVDEDDDRGSSSGNVVGDFWDNCAMHILPIRRRKASGERY